MSDPTPEQIAQVSDEIPMEDLVMRSVFFRLLDDARLRQLSHELKVSRSTLIRVAIQQKLQEWRENPEMLAHYLEVMKRK